MYVQRHVFQRSVALGVAVAGVINREPSHRYTHSRRGLLWG